MNYTPAERVEAVWTLTLACLQWNSKDLREPRLQRSVRVFNEHEVEYLVVDAHAMAAHGHVRATEDLDIWVRAEPANAEKILAALKALGTATHDLSRKDLTEPGTIFQIGMPPFRIDILTAIDGVKFGEAWPDRMRTEFGGQPVAVISRHHLIVNKKISSRLQDLADVESLEKQSLK